MGIEKLIGRLVLAVIFGIILASALPTFAQITEPIVVTTDKSSYQRGEIIFVRGEVAEIIPDTDVGLVVIGPPPFNNIVAIDQIPVGADRKFSTLLSTTGNSWGEDGIYTIKVTYGNQAVNNRVLIELLGEPTLQDQIDALVIAIGQLFDTMVGGFELLGIAINDLQTQADDQETRISEIESGPSSIIAHLDASVCGPPENKGGTLARVGWCPDGSSFEIYFIPESSITAESVVTVTLDTPFSTFGPSCKVMQLLQGDGFLLRCSERGAVNFNVPAGTSMNYAVLNPDS